VVKRLAEDSGGGIIGVGAEEAAADQRRADEIFSRLGVEQVVITWSGRVTGEPMFARSTG
jgi:hypothetical protein